MVIKLAKTAGFCMGVRRAVSIVMDEVHKSNDKIYTYGPLIHNDQAINLLETQNVSIIKDLNKTDIKSKKIVIRAHGVPKEAKKQISEKGGIICDATCPHVMRAQSLSEKYSHDGYNILIIGDKGHAEVLGILGHSDGKGFVIEKENDINELPDNVEKVCVIAQTTQEREHFDKLVEIIKSKYRDVQVFNTICDSTSRRQKEVIRLSKEVDAMVIVGGKGSANTVRLAEIAQSMGTMTFHIETADDLNIDEIRKYNDIGVTAGASTPNWIIRNVIEKLYDIQQTSKFALTEIFYKFFKILIQSQIYLAIGAAALTFTTCIMLKVPFAPESSMTNIAQYVILSFFYVLSMHIANRLFILPKGNIALDTIQIFFFKNKNFLIIIGFISIIISLYISFKLGMIIFILMILSILLGTLYTFAIFPAFLVNILKYRRLKDIPGSKDIFSAAGWAMSSVVIPFINSPEKHIIALIPTAIFASTIVLIRSIQSDLREIENDLFVGKETIPIVFGIKKTIRFISYTLMGLVIVLILSGVAKILPLTLSLCLTAVPVLSLLILQLFKKGLLLYSFYYNLLLEGQFILAGLIGLAYYYFIR